MSELQSRIDEDIHVTAYHRFPPNWPVYSPSVKLANWLEHYADIMELNVWLSSKITSISQDPESGKWDVTIVRKVSTANGEPSY